MGGRKEEEKTDNLQLLISEGKLKEWNCRMPTDSELLRSYLLIRGICLTQEQRKLLDKLWGERLGIVIE